MVIGERTTEIQHIVSRPQYTIRHTADSGCDFQPHSHNSYTVTSVLSGLLRTSVGANNLEVKEGETVFTAIGVTHSGTARTVEFVSVAISPALMNALVSELGLVSRGNEVVFRAAKTDDPDITATARTIAAEASVVKVGQGAMLDALVRQLGVHLLRNHIAVRRSAQIEISRAGPVDRRIRLALEFIHDNYARDLALEEIASAAYLSEYHFARLFKQISGVTPHVYLANVRIERARQLLLDTPASINEVAAAVGYQSQSHFTRLFKAVTGLTPRAYRNGALRHAFTAGESDQ
ncbi:MAG TPA: helix-turn-helix domain-containing protein [Blastocatellia bacterium]|nr:helix-turn-helix domain-containing protein [Blastocatellia bacterium]